MVIMHASVKHLSRFQIAFGLAALFSMPSVAETPPTFAVGQEWTVKPSDRNEPTSLHVIIVKIETSGGQTVVHTSLTGIKCPNGNTVSLGHAPIDADALSASVDRVIATGVQPAHGFEESYTHWKADAAGAWNVSVPEISAMLLKEVGPAHIGC